MTEGDVLLQQETVEIWRFYRLVQQVDKKKKKSSTSEDVLCCYLLLLVHLPGHNHTPQPSADSAL